MKRRFPEVISTFKREKISSIIERSEKLPTIEDLDIDPVDPEVE
jgi:hypothetical protein